jgi:hypothetical protein
MSNVGRQSSFPIVLKYHCTMQVATGTVIDGKVIIEGLSPPEGTLVTVATRESEATVRLLPSDEAELLEALDEADREEGISAEELFERLRRFG